MTKRKAEHNKGYSLIEMIIVIAIIALVSSLSLVSVTLIHSAKAKDAAIKFDNEIATLIAKTKSQTPPAASPGEYALKVYSTGDKYYIAEGVLKDDGTFIQDPDNVVSLSSYVTVTFTGTNSEGEVFADDAIGDGDRAVIITYNKRGICLEGVGTYSFYKKNGNIVAKVFLRKNGSHESK